MPTPCPVDSSSTEAPFRPRLLPLGFRPGPLLWRGARGDWSPLQLIPLLPNLELTRPWLPSALGCGAKPFILRGGRGARTPTKSRPPPSAFPLRAGARLRGLSLPPGLLRAPLSRECWARTPGHRQLGTRKLLVPWAPLGTGPGRAGPASPGTGLFPAGPLPVCSDCWCGEGLPGNSGASPALAPRVQHGSVATAAPTPCSAARQLSRLGPRPPWDVMRRYRGTDPGPPLHTALSTSRGASVMVSVGGGGGWGRVLPQGSGPHRNGRPFWDNTVSQPRGERMDLGQVGRRWLPREDIQAVGARGGWLLRRAR